MSNVFNDNSETYKRFIAERVHLYANTVLPLQLANNIETQIKYTIHAAEQLVMTISSWCTAGRVEDRLESETVKYPIDTWEMFKFHHMPKWFTRRFPIKYKEIFVEKARHIYFMCPHIDLPDNRNQHIEFMTTGWNPRNAKF